MGQNVYTTVRVSPRNVYVGQPSKYTVKVYTDTWFTQGTTFQPFTLNDAFVVSANNQVGTERINGQTYGFVEHNYWIYPYNAGELLLPQQKMVVHSPAPGLFKASPRTLMSKTAKLNVTANPPQIRADAWLVAQSLNRSASWSGPTNALKVGDVLERTITIDAYGTMASFMPELQWEKMDGVSTYPQSARISTETPERSSAIIAKQKQTVAYLFEEAGTYTIPAVAIGYWDVRQHRWIDRSLPALTIDVAPNNDISVLASHRDSLMQQVPQQADFQKAGEQEIAWRDWGKWAVYVFLGIVTLLLMWLMIRRLRAVWLKHKQSESYVFRQLLRTQSEVQFYKRLYQWLACVADETSINELVKMKASAHLQGQFKHHYSRILGQHSNRQQRNAFLILLRKELGTEATRKGLSLNP